MGKVQRYLESTAVSFLRSSLLRTLRSRRIRWNSVSPIVFSLMVRKAMYDSWRACRRFTWVAMIRFEWRSVVVRVRWCFWKCHNCSYCVADCFGKKATKRSSSVLIKSSSKASTSGRAQWISSYMSVSTYQMYLPSYVEFSVPPECHTLQLAKWWADLPAPRLVWCLNQAMLPVEYSCRVAEELLE